MYFLDWTVEETMDAVKKIIANVEKRLIINLKEYQVHIVDKDGIRKVGDIKAE